MATASAHAQRIAKRMSGTAFRFPAIALRPLAAGNLARQSAKIHKAARRNRVALKNRLGAALALRKPLPEGPRVGTEAGTAPAWPAARKSPRRINSLNGCAALLKLRIALLSRIGRHVVFTMGRRNFLFDAARQTPLAPPLQILQILSGRCRAAAPRRAELSSYRCNSLLLLAIDEGTCWTKARSLCVGSWSHSPKIEDNGSGRS